MILLFRLPVTSMDSISDGDDGNDPRLLAVYLCSASRDGIPKRFSTARSELSIIIDDQYVTDMYRRRVYIN
jgi:hypothetical protein